MFAIKCSRSGGLMIKHNGKRGLRMLWIFGLAFATNRRTSGYLFYPATREFSVSGFTFNHDDAWFKRWHIS